MWLWLSLYVYIVNESNIVSSSHSYLALLNDSLLKGLLAPLLSLAFLLSLCSLILSLPPLSLFCPLQVLMTGLYSSALSLFLSVSTTLSTPLPMCWINSILYYTMWLVPQGEGMPQHGPTEAHPFPIPDYTSTKTHSFSIFIKHNKYSLHFFPSISRKQTISSRWTFQTSILTF